MVLSTIPPYEDALASLGLDGTVVTIYDQNISLAVESKQAFPQRLMHETIQKLGTIMQNRSPTTVTYLDVSKDFLSPMLFFQKPIARTYKDTWSHRLTCKMLKLMPCESCKGHMPRFLRIVRKSRQP